MIKNVFLLSAILLIIDMAYLSMISNKFGSMVKDIQGSEMKVRWDSALIAYVFIIFQIYHFILQEDKTEYDAFLLGVTTYGIYDFTSYALLDNYNLPTAIMDSVWGGILYFLTIKIYRSIVL